MVEPNRSAAHPVIEERRPNHLQGEKSPYLLQHLYNPVDWYPWGDAAFALARAENRPIFLSIGYATCHWCHVMERESFEDARVAELLNENFVPIKVDREERPDVDRLYMSAMQALGMGGGWPLNAFLTPNLEPFFGGTYFPPDARSGRPGMLQILPRITQLWRDNHGELVDNGQKLLEALEGSLKVEGEPASYDVLIAHARAELESRADTEHGGFGRAPKFPTVVNLDFLLRSWSRDPRARGGDLEIVRMQLDHMRAGGIHDHLGGGFHRYAVDREWRVSHFEKMLYDQAQLALAYLEAFQVTGEPSYPATARGIFNYVARDLTSPEGAFYSAEDADSEGEEGRFYAWDPAELEAVLGREDAALVAARYGVTREGNFEHGRSVLHETGPADASNETRLAAARAKLFAARKKRVRPLRDDKVLVAWNGLMISAFARGAYVLGDETLETPATRAATFLWQTLFDEKTGDLRRRWREGEAAGAGQLDDYAFFARGLFDLYQTTFDPLWLERSIRLVSELVQRFRDPETGGLFESPAGDRTIPVRLKDAFDGAEIAGNSIALDLLFTFGTLLDREDWRAEAKRGFDAYAVRLAEYPAAMPRLLTAMMRSRTKARHIVIAATRRTDAQALVVEFDRSYRPFDVLLYVEEGEVKERLARLLPWVALLSPIGGRAAAYVCEDYACRRPTVEPEEFRKLLAGG